MSTQLDVFIYGLVYVGVSLIFGTITLYLAIKSFEKLTRDIDDMKEMRENNVAVALINGAIVFSVAMFITEAVASAMEAFKNSIFDYSGNLTVAYRLKIYGIMLSHFILTFIISFLVLWIAVQIFIHLTRSIDEFEEIKKNNHAVGIFLAVFIISITLILKPAVGKLLKGIIPFPEVSTSPRVSLIVDRSSTTIAYNFNDIIDVETGLKPVSTDVADEI